LPDLLTGVRKKFPGLKISLREGYPAHLEELLAKDEIDLAITLIEDKPAAGVQSLVLLRLPMVLLVEKSSKIKSAGELWRRDKINEPLICLPRQEALTRTFTARLQELGVEWFPAIEASSASLIEIYVASGLGIGVSLQVPGKALPKNVSALPLLDFPQTNIGALWRGKKTALLDAFLDMARQRVREII
jgi:DNA-binding transcriptional LysR family regulator